MLRANPDLAVAQHVTHFAVGAIQRLAGFEAHTAAAFNVDRYSSALARGFDARRFRWTFAHGFAVDPHRGRPARALDVAVHARGRRSDRRGRPVRHARLASQVEIGALIRREEESAEL